MQPGLFLRVLASSFFLILSFPRPDVGVLSLIALVPLFSQLSRVGRRRAFLNGWGAGTVWFFVSYNWVSHSLTDFGGIPLPLAGGLILLLAGIHGIYVGVFSLLIPVVSRLWKVDSTGAREQGSRGAEVRLASNCKLTHLLTPLLVLPSAWVLLEVMRSWFPAPFPWLLLGSAAGKIPFSGALFELVGVYGASFWIVAVNVTVWMILCAGRGVRMRAGIQLVVVLLLPMLLYPVYTESTGQKLRVGVVQGNFSQELKWEESLRDETLKIYLSLSDDAADEGAQIVVWPETAVPSFYQSEPELVEKLKTFASDRKIHLIFGSPGYDISGREVYLYNRVYHLMPDGKEEFYDKNMLVPFGEYVPLSGLFPFIEKMVPGEGEFARGVWNQPFKTPVPSGALVCYEVSIPSLARREVRDGSLLLVNVTNDAWFGRSWGPYQHLAITSIRAKENRVPILRAANTGISAIIDRRGRVVRSIPMDERGVIVADIETAAGQTPYTRTGDWIVILCIAVLSLYFLVLLNAWRSRRWTG